MKNVKVSILIPVYNTERYLEKCLDSVINQTLKEIEIIITNDGSTDRSEDIIKEYIKKDSRIIYTKQINLGLGATRNKGIELAKGEYLAFLDSDDWVDLDYYEKLYLSACRDKSDLVISSYVTENILMKKSIINNVQIEEKDSYINSLLEGKIPGFSWNKLYKNEIIKSNNLRFPLRGELENVEDQYFSLRALSYSKRISFITESFIHYRLNRQSIVNKYQKNLVNDIKNLHIENIKFFKDDKKKIEIINHNTLRSIIFIISNEFKYDRNVEKKEKLKILKYMIDDKIYKELLLNLKYDKFNKKDALYLFLLKKKQIQILYYISSIRFGILSWRRKLE